MTGSKSQDPQTSKPRPWGRLLLLIALVIALGWFLLQNRDRRVVRRPPLTVQLQQAPLTAAQVGATLPMAEMQAGAPRNLILFIGDGLGFAHLSAARAALHGINGPASWDRFTTTGWQHTHPASGFLTESAAAATALATGQPTSLEAVAVDVEGQPLETLFERAADFGYRTGIVTDSYVWDATPAAFVTHSLRRGNASAESALRQLAESSLEILAGELEHVGWGTTPDWDASIELLGRRFEILGPEPSAAMLEALEVSASPIAAVFREDQLGDLDSNPTLPALAAAALRRLSSTERPFLLLIESEESDTASHDADFHRFLRGMQAIEATLEILLDFAAENGETLLVFTSDHETGGLVLSTAKRRNSELRPIWSTSGHSGVPVPVFAIGPGAEAFDGIHANWEIGRLLSQSLQR